MGFIGKYFSVVIATAHIPLSHVAAKINFKFLSDALLNTNSLRKLLPTAIKKRPIAVLGLNPHSGEESLMGNEEASIFPNLLQFARENKIPMHGPIVPDAAFLKKNWSRYSVFLALYHDQGLIPFKTIHGQDSGVHITLGIPFIRTSVDHGTAKDIFGKNKANHRSMTEALEWAIKLSK
jgi:4-hydroxythreonine-4-phosphate dehydrogenase